MSRGKRVRKARMKKKQQRAHAALVRIVNQSLMSRNFIPFYEPRSLEEVMKWLGP